MKKLDSKKKAEAASFAAGMVFGTGVGAGATQFATDALSQGAEELTPVEEEEEVELVGDTSETTPPPPAPSAESHPHTEPSTAHTAPEPAYEASEDAPEADEEVEVEVQLEDPVGEVIVEEEYEEGTQEATDEVELNIVGFETVTLNDGTQSDFAYFESGGRSGAIVDLDQDGRADFMMYDANANGEIEEPEVFDVREENWDMAMFHSDVHSVELPQDVDDEIANDEYYAFDEDSSDYINDADVDDFLEA